MGTTPTYSWPYPESTDPVANGAQDIEDLALAVETTVSGLPAGKILQVVSTTKDDTFSASVAARGSTAITGLTATITPSSTGSKVLVIANLVGATSDGPYGVSCFNLTRGGTAISQPASPGSRLPMTTFNLGITGATVMDAGAAHYLDSPATTSSVTYGVDMVNTSGITATLYVNRGADDTDANTRRRTVSSITVMEVSS